MHTVTFTPVGKTEEETVTQVTKIEFSNHGTEIIAHSQKDGAHTIPTSRIRQID